MRFRRSCVVVLGVGFVLPPVGFAAGDIKKKEDVVASVEKQRADLIKLSDQIWGFAETALKETKSSKVLADHAEKQGFKVVRGVANLPTAFIASYGEGHPIIGILGEFDALPGLSQKATPVKEPVEPGAPGHGCGHNLFGPGSLGAATAIKELIEAGKLKGTIRFYGTPAEEAVGGKIYMAREGLFNDVDVCLAWHPADETLADARSSQALVDFIVEFHGKAAHAAHDPWNGRSAVDGLELFTHGLNMMREHVKPSVRMHYVIQDGGLVPNIVPEYAKLWCWVRDWTRTGADEVFGRAKKIAEGAALMAGVESKVTVLGGDYEMLVNMTGAKLLNANLNWLGPIEYTKEEQEFARAIQRAVGKPEKGLNGVPKPLEGQEAQGGSTDVGDISWIVPTLHVSVTTAPEDTPWHAWPVVACGGMSIGHKGMIHAAKILAATMVDLFEDSKTREAIQAEFKEQTKGQVYKPYIPDGPPMLPSHEPSRSAQ
jgi:aminobenzoyl-glutamate utilization protein B